VFNNHDGGDGGCSESGEETDADATDG